MPQLIVTGMATGCIYALVAFGFVLIYNAVGALNFAQGDFVMIGGYLGAWTSVTLDFPVWVAFGATIALMAAFGIVFQRLLYVPLQDKPIVTFLVASIGAGIVLRNVALVVFGPEPRSVPPLLGAGSIDVLSALLSKTYVIVLILTTAVLAGLWWLFTHTMFGKSLRATAQDATTARLMGIRVRTMITATFVLSAVLSGIAGFVLGPIVFVYPEVGLPLIINGFIAVVIGGFGSLPGAVVGGMLVGLAQVFVATYVSSTWTQVYLFALLLALLIAWPRGIFGEPVSEKV
ncbi:MAG TPA: branched-chain amino acid ABC transporter permease [Solirubrobacter sp.]|nr:branched-chain amino acid ABC transporter permease [Solirubrobacter sp.]